MKNLLSLLFILFAIAKVNAQCIEAFPYSEDFEQTGFVVPTTDPNAGTVPACWTRNITTGLYWRPDRGATGQFNTGPSVDHTTGTGKYLVMEADGTNFTATNTNAITPWVDLSGTTSPEIRFWLHQFGFSTAGMGVQIQRFGSTTWTGLGTVTGSQTSSTGAWEEKFFGLSLYVNDTIRIRFVGNRTFGFSSFCQTAIDDISINEASSCQRPFNFAVQTRTQTSITFTFSSQNPTVPSEIRYIEAGQNLSQAVIVSGGTNNPITVTGLNPSTSYLFWLRDSCSTGYSNWTSAISATTLCGTLTAPYSESFEGPDFVSPTGFNDPGSIQSCWNRNPTSGYTWIIGPEAFLTGFSGPASAHDGSKWAQTARAGFSTNNGPLFRSPRIDLTPLTNPELRFWSYMYGSNIDRLEVEVKTLTGNWTNVLTLTGQDQSNQTDPWDEQVISLSSFANQTIFVRFKGFHNGTTFNADIAIDDITIDEAPPCPRPTILSLVGTSFNSATLSWVSSGTSPWQIEYGAPGYTAGTGTIVAATSNPFTVTGLSPQTSYDFYIRDTCGAFGVSNWTGPVRVQTECTPVAAPWSEDFEGSNFANSGQFNTQGTIDPCWRAPGSQAGFFWTPSPVAFQLTSTGPLLDHTTGTGDYIYATNSGFNAGDSALLQTPLVDLGSLTNPQLSFWYHMYGDNIRDFVVEVWDGSTWSTELTITGQQQTTNGAAWKEGIVNLASYANDTISVRFTTNRAGAFGTNVRAALDDIVIDEQPACPRPTTFTIGSPTTTSLVAVWDTVGGSSWIIEYGPPGFTLGAGTQVTVTSSPHTVTGLLPGTTYEFYVISDCGAQGQSDETGPENGTTVCATKNAPYRETFDGIDWIPALNFGSNGELGPCWVRQDTVNYIWKPMSGQTFPTATGPQADHTTGSGKYVYSDVSGFSATNTVLRMPEINLTPLDTPELRFWYYMYGAGISSLRVQVKQGTAPWTTVNTITGQQQASPSEPWQERTVSLAAYQNQTVFIRFVAERASTSFFADVAIDDVSVDEQPQCPAPTNLSATGVSESAIEVSWTSGGGSSWVIEYGLSGFALGTGTTITVQNNPFIVTGLATNATYDFYVRDSCSNGGLSIAQGPVSASTYPCADACLYELKLEDQNSNGWSIGFGGNFTHFVDVIVDGNTTSYTLESGASATFFIPVCDSLPVELFFRSSGFQSNECGIEFRDPAGTLLYDRNFGTTLATGSLFTTTGNCVPTCSDPVGLTIQNITSNSVDAFWSSLSGTSNIAVGAPGFNPTNPTSTNITTGSSALTGLNPNTTYDVYVQDTCTNGLLSSWVGPVSFTTISCSPPTASFVSSTSGLVANFDGSGSSGLVTTHTWRFGDGTSGSGANDAHTYAAPGIYTVTLIVSNPCGVLDSVSQQVVVCGSPSAAFTAQANGLSVDLDGSISAGIGMTYFWDFNDGNTGAGVNPTHVYVSAGTYNILLIVTDTCGSTDTTMLPVLVCDAPTASFTLNVTGLSVALDASASTGANQYFWDYGDGNSGTGVTSTHTYASNANYNILLYAVNACGDTAIDTQVVALCTDPFASWTYQIISSGGNGMLVQFDATNSAGTTYFWDFGDGSTASGTNFPTHTYLTPGLFYRVTLIVGNDCGDTDTLAYRLSSIGVEENVQWRSKLYPNPTSGSFFIEMTDLGRAIEGINILSVDGRIVASPSFDAAAGNRLSLIFNEPPGVYFVQVLYDDGHLETHRLLIDR